MWLGPDCCGPNYNPDIRAGALPGCQLELVEWPGQRRSARTDGGSLLELPGCLLSWAWCSWICVKSLFEIGDPTVQAGCLPTAARSLHRLCSSPRLIIAVSVEEIEEDMEVGRARGGQSWMESGRDRWLGGRERGKIRLCKYSVNISHKPPRHHQCN